MGDWAIPISIVLCYGSLLVFAYFWFEEILMVKFYAQLYLTIFLTAILWSFYLGTKSYTVWYSLSKDEAGEIRTIEFPIIWM